MAMPSSCSHWWHAPIYIAATAALIIAAISSSSFNALAPSDDLISTLHHSGFHLTAINLQLSTTTTTSSSSSPFTLFALPDSALSELPFPSADHLLRLHTSPLPLPFSTLSSLPRGTSIPSLLPNHNLTLTLLIGDASSSVAINGVPISHPNLFVGGPHGVSATFPPSFHYENVDWARVARAVGSKGYVSFAMGLSSVLDALPPLDHATVFAPRDREGGFDGYVAGARDELARAVRRHVAVQRLGYGELAAKRVGEEIGTVEKDWGLMITDGESWNSNRAVVEVNGVEITEGEVYADDKVVVHGVAMAFASEGETTL